MNQLEGIFEQKRYERKLKTAAKLSNCTITIIGRPGNIYHEGPYTFTVHPGYLRLKIKGDLPQFWKVLHELDHQ